MDKVYVRFGEFTKREEFITCFEAVVEDHIVKIILPTATYPSCQLAARLIEDPAFIVTGDYVGKGKNGEPILTNIKFKVPIKLDKEQENYVTDFFIPSKKHKSGTQLPKWFRK